MTSLKKTLNSQLKAKLGPTDAILNSLADESGQILIIILLVLVVGVSIVLSLSARSITDIRTTTSTEQSNRAYFAAEAGIERALQQIKDNAVTGNIVGSGGNLGNNASYTGTIASTGGSAQAFYFSGLKDTTTQVNLRTTVTDDTTGLNGGRLNVYWHTTASPQTSDTAALEVTLLRKNSATGSYSLDKYACDPFVATRSNGFSCGGAASSSFTISGNCATPTLSGISNNSSITNFCNKVGITINASANEKTLLARIRPIYAGDGIAVEYANSAGTAPALALPQQGYTITSTGVGTDGSNRKLVVFRSFPSLPTVFDFVLYNGSNNALQKPWWYA